MQVIQGPADCGNVFGFFRRGLVPAGKFAIVEHGEFANGGFGLSLVVSSVFASREEAESELQRLEQVAAE